jgi:hypothetical protein
MQAIRFAFFNVQNHAVWEHNTTGFLSKPSVPYFGRMSGLLVCCFGFCLQYNKTFKKQLKPSFTTAKNQNIAHVTHNLSLD